MARCGTVAVPLQRRCGRRCRAVGKTQNGMHEYFLGLDARSVVSFVVVLNLTLIILVFVALSMRLMLDARCCCQLRTSLLSRSRCR